MNKQITEDYVSYEFAVLLKEKGFDEPTRFWYDDKGIISQKYINPTNNPLGKSWSYAAPTQSLVLKWLREVHNIYIDILTYTTGKSIQFRWVGYDNGRLFSQEEGKTIYFNSYNEAVEAALKYTLENLI